MNRANWFVYGFLACFFILSVSRSFSKSTQVSTSRDSFDKVDAELNNIFFTMQQKEFDHFDSTPVARNIKSLNVVFVGTGSLSLMTQWNGSRHYFPMTLLP